MTRNSGAVKQGIGIPAALRRRSYRAAGEEVLSASVEGASPCPVRVGLWVSLGLIPSHYGNEIHLDSP